MAYGGNYGNFTMEGYGGDQVGPVGMNAAQQNAYFGVGGPGYVAPADNGSAPGGNGDPSMPNNQAQSGTIGGTPGSGQQDSLTTPAPAGGQDYAANYANSGYGQGYGSPAGLASGQTGGGGMYGIGSGSTGQVGGYSTGLQQYPDSSNTYGQSTMSGGASGGQMAGSSGQTGGNQPLGSTTQGTPSYGQTGGGFNPASANNPFNQAQPWNGGPASTMSSTGFNPGQNAQGANPYLTMSGFQQGGIGAPPTTAYNQYQGMLSDPTSMTANPAYKAIMDAAVQASSRAQLAHGGNGGGTMAAELAKTGASVAGQYLPQMANMYQQGAQQEIGNWNTTQQANLGAGQLGSNLYGQANQANLGYGNLGNNAWTNAANNQYNLGTAYGQMQNGAANTSSAALAQAQMQPANSYFQNQLTMSGMG